jgi:hypothetical protein
MLVPVVHVCKLTAYEGVIAAKIEKPKMEITNPI